MTSISEDDPARETADFDIDDTLRRALIVGSVLGSSFLLYAGVLLAG